MVGSIGHRLQQLKQVADAHGGGSAEAAASFTGTPGQHGQLSPLPDDSLPPGPGSCLSEKIQQDTTKGSCCKVLIGYLTEAPEALTGRT